MRDEFAQIVRQARARARLRQQEVAAKTGIDPSRLSRIETGKLRPTREEVMAILDVVETEERYDIAEIVLDDLKHISAPTWSVLSNADRAGLVRADQAIAKLEQVRFPRSLDGHIDKLKQSLLDNAAYLVNPHHPICMVGHIGVGKSTLANALFNLTEGFGKRRRRRKGAADSGLLPTGGGGTTAFEFHLSYGPEPAIRIEAQREDVILREVSELCAFWIAEARSTEKRERAVTSEMERLYRNMAGLARSGGADPVRELIKPNTDPDSLMFEVAARLNLSARTRVAFLYREDRKKGQSEADWLRQQCEALNLGKLADCPLPRRLDITLPNPALKADGFRFTLVDLRGIATSDPRPDVHPDLVAAYSDPRALLVLCSNFLDAPDHCAQSVVDRLKSRSASNEGPLDQKRVTLLVLPWEQQPQSVRDDDGTPARDREEGYHLKRRQVVDRLGDTADKLAIQFFDARKDDPEPIRGHILSRVEAIRQFKRDEIAHLDETIDALIADIGKAHFQVTQNKVKEKIENFLKSGSAKIDKISVATWIKLVRALNQLHASSVWSAARGGGEGRSVDIYYFFSELMREDSKERTDRAATELKALLKDILGDADMRRREMARSRTFVAEIITMADAQHEAFLNQTGPFALNALKQAFQKDVRFWQSCAELWGQGGGFRAQVAAMVEDWFKRHIKTIQHLDDRVDAAWDETFVGWLRTYTVDAGNAS